MRTVTAASVAAGEERIEGLPGSVLEALGDAVEGEALRVRLGYDPHLAGAVAEVALGDAVLAVDPATGEVELPAALLPDGPATLVLRGRVTDESGRAAEAILELGVQNRPPTLTAPLYVM